MKDGLVRVHSGLTDVPVLLRASSDHWGLDSQVGIQTNLDHNPDFFTQLIAGTLVLLGLSIFSSVEWGHLLL